MQTEQNSQAGSAIGIFVLAVVILGVGLSGGIGIANLLSPDDNVHAPGQDGGDDDGVDAVHADPAGEQAVAPVVPLTPAIELAEWGSPMPTSMLTSDCLACHQVAIKIVGPAYNQVADKYQGQPEQVRKLARKVIQGGVGVWGEIPMAPHPQHTFEQAQEMVAWILGQTTEPPAAKDEANSAEESAAPTEG